VFRRTRGSLNWQQVVISLQTLLAKNLVVGGRTALELQGYSHYLAHETKEVHLYGPKRPPAWVDKLALEVQFRYHNSERLFGKSADPASFQARIRFDLADEYRITTGQSCYPGVGTMGMEAHPLLARASGAGTPR